MLSFSNQSIQENDVFFMAIVQSPLKGCQPLLLHLILLSCFVLEAHVNPHAIGQGTAPCALCVVTTGSLYTMVKMNGDHCYPEAMLCCKTV